MKITKYPYSVHTVSVADHEMAMKMFVGEGRSYQHVSATSFLQRVMGRQSTPIQSTMKNYNIRGRTASAFVRYSC